MTKLRITLDVPLNCASRKSSGSYCFVEVVVEPTVLAVMDDTVDDDGHLVAD